MRAMRSRLPLASLAIVFAVIFLALMVWQIERRSWKLDLIARVEQRVHEPASALPARESWSRINANDHEYRHVEVRGKYIASSDTLVQAVTELGPGYWVISPLRLDDGSIVMINRGFIAQGTRPTQVLTDTATVVRGLLRMTEPGGGFLRKNDASADRWYSRDVQAIAAARHLAAANPNQNSRVAPFFIDEEAAVPSSNAKSAAAGPGDSMRPTAGLTVIAFHNSHLVYAFTWCTLALMAAAAAWYIIRLDKIDAGTGSVGRD